MWSRSNGFLLDTCALVRQWSATVTPYESLKLKAHETLSLELTIKILLTFSLRTGTRADVFLPFTYGCCRSAIDYPIFRNSVPRCVPSDCH